MIIIVSMWLIPAYHCNSPNLLHIIDIDMLFSSVTPVYFHHHLVYTHIKWDFFWGVVSESYPGCIHFFGAGKFHVWNLLTDLCGACTTHCRGDSVLTGKFLLLSWWQMNAVRSAWACPPFLMGHEDLLGCPVGS